MGVPTWEDPEIYQIETENQANQDDWPKETWKKCPIKVIQTATTGKIQGLWVCPYVYPHVLYSFFLLINILLASLLSIFVEILLWKAEGPELSSLTTSLAASICCFHCCNPAQSLAGNPSSVSSCCKLKSPDQVTQSDSIPVIGATSVPDYCYFSLKLVRAQSITILSLILNA